MLVKSPLLKKSIQINNPQDWSTVIATPFGKLGIRTENFEGSLMIGEIFYVSQTLPLLKPKDALAKDAVMQIEAYLQNPRHVFDLPLAPKGTLFQKKVWEQIAQIPLGMAQSYGQVAKKIHSAPRAVGGACGANPYPLIVPCHRVVSATGIGGFAHQDEEGYHRNIKTWLLRHEGYLL